METTLCIIIVVFSYLIIGRVIINLMEHYDIIEFDVYDIELKTIATILFPILVMWKFTVWIANGITKLFI